MAAQQNRRLLVRFIAGAANPREAERARRLVISEPEMARLYAELVLASDSAISGAMAEARTKLKTARLLEEDLVGAAEPSQMPVQSEATFPSDLQAEPKAKTWRVRLQLVSLLTIWTLFGIGLGYIFCPVSPWLSPDKQLPAAGQVRLMVRGPRQLWPGLSHNFRVTATSQFGLPHPSQVRLRLIDAAGRLKYSALKRTDHRQDWLDFCVPGLAITGNSVLEARVEPDGGTPAQQTARLQCRDTAYVTMLTTDREVYFPGDEIFVRSLTVAALDACSYREHQLQFELLDRRRAGRGRAVNSVAPVRQVTHSGLAFGRLALPPSLPRGNYEVVARNPAGQVATTRKRIRIERPAPPLREDSPRRGIVTLRMVPEGGVLVPEIPNSIFVTANDNQGRPAKLQVRVVAANQDHSAGSSTGAAPPATEYLLTTNARGQGRLQFVPKLGVRYELAAKSEDGRGVRGRFPSVSQDHYHVLHTPQGIINESQVRLLVRSRESAVPLSIIATCRGATVGHRDLELSATRDVPDQKPDQDGILEADLVLPLKSEAFGLIELVLYDRRFDPPRAIAARQIFRRPWQGLQLEVRPVGDSDANHLSLVVAVRDESGMPVNATVGVMVKAGDCQMGHAAKASYRPLSDQWLLGNLAQNISAWPQEGHPKNGWEREMEFLLGTQVRRFGELPLGFWRRRGTVPSAEPMSLLIDNGSDVDTRLQSSLRKSRRERLSQVRRLGYAMLAVAACVGGLMWLSRFPVSTGEWHRWPSRVRRSIGILGLIASLVLGFSWVGAFTDVHGKMYPGFRFMAAFQNPPENSDEPADKPAIDPSVSDTESLTAVQSSAGKRVLRVGIDLPPPDTIPSLDKFELAELYAQVDDAFMSGDRSRCGILRQLIQARISSERQPPEPFVWSQRLTPGKLLYWHPAIQPGDSGDARLEFAMPRHVRHIELTIEAHHQGRFGLLQTTFVADAN